MATSTVHLGGAGGHFQNLTVQFPNATIAREVSLTVTGWRGGTRQEARSFVIEGLSMSNTDSIRAQITDRGRELILENRGAAKAFNLRLRSGFKAEEVGQRTGLQIDAGSVVLLKPSNWSPAVSTTAPIHLEVLDSTWQKILKSSIV